MRRPIALLALVACLYGFAGAESFTKRLARGQALLNTGDIDEAITIFRDLQVDQPDSPTLHYDLGCAQYAKALQAARDSAVSDAATALEEAASSFDEASRTPDNALRKNAQFNRATALGQLAKQKMGAGDPNATMEAFEEAIASFEDFLHRYPNDEDAQANLNNLRYELKKYLQQTPPPQQQQNPQGGEGEDKQQNDQENQQENQESQQPQQGDESQNDPQNQQDQGDEEQPSEQPQEDQQEGNQEPQEQPEQQLADENAEPQGQPESQEMAENRENIEAILDSLQDRDEREQREMRQQPFRKGIDRNWW